MINCIIVDSGMCSGFFVGGGGGYFGGDRGGCDVFCFDCNVFFILKEGEDMFVIMVFDRIVGFIIGCGGEMICDFQECSGCYINIVLENKSVNGFCFVNFIGILVVIKNVKEFILEIVDSDSCNMVIGGNVCVFWNDGGYGGGG